MLSSSDILDLKYRNGTATLTINEVYPEDEGVYTCKAQNTLGVVETTCRLNVQSKYHDFYAAMASNLIQIFLAAERACHRVTGQEKPPRIVEHVSSRIVNDGESVVLQCRIGAASKFDVIWLHNEKEIKPSKDFQYDRSGDLCILKIAEIFPEDAGTYTCEVFNDVGEAFSTCTLLVVGKSNTVCIRNSVFKSSTKNIVPNEEVKSPTFKQFPQSQTIAQGQTVTFTCETDKAPAKGELH